VREEKDKKEERDKDKKEEVKAKRKSPPEPGQAKKVKRTNWSRSTIMHDTVEDYFASIERVKGRNKKEKEKA